MPASDTRPTTEPGGGEGSWSAGLLWSAVYSVLVLLAFEPINLWPAALVAAAPITWLALTAGSTWRASACLVVIQLPLWLWLQRWVIDVTTMGYGLLGVYMSLYPPLYVWLIRRVRRVRRLAVAPLAVTVPVIWVGIECIRGEIVFAGYPWFLLGHPLIGWTPLVQSADVFGAYAGSFLAAMTAGATVDLLAAPRRRVPIVAAAVVWLANIGYGLFRTAQDAPLRPGPSVLVIQTDLPQSNKVRWTAEQQLVDFGRFMQQTADAWRAGAADLIVWPETMLPGFGLDPESIATLMAGPYEPGDYYAKAIQAAHRETGAALLVGSPSFEGLRVEEGSWRWDAHFNSAYLVDGAPPYQRYDKVHLTPFGETMPYVSAWPALEEMLLGLGAAGMRFDLDAGEAPVVLELDRPGEPIGVATPICFEDTVGRVCRRLVHDADGKRAAVLINLSNDGWFGSRGAGRAQHNQAARFRCIENRVPMVRAVNTGQSVAFDSSGNVAGVIGRGRYGTARQPGHLRAELRLDDRRTLYGRWGDAGAWGCLLATIVLAACSYVRGGKGTDRST